MELGDDDTLGAVDDEGPVIGHQRDVTEVDLLLLDVPDALHTGLDVLVPDHQPNRHLERHGVRHAALLTLLDVVLDLQADRVLADIANDATGVVGRPALRAEDLVLTVGICHEHGTA